MATQGIFCWHDLSTSDVEGAKAFYGELLGWTAEAMDMEGTMYTILRNAWEQVGGVMPLPEGAPYPPHWMPYVTVEACDAALEQLKALGGSVYFGPEDIPNVGRFAMVADDQGVGFAVVSLHDDPQARVGDYRHGEFCWYTLATRDVAKAQAFYGALVGWSAVETDMAGPPQLIFTRGGAPTASLLPVVGDAMPPHWGVSVCVEGVEPLLETAVRLGGAVLMPPMSVGPLGRVAVISDPAGAVISLFEGAAAPAEA